MVNTKHEKKAAKNERRRLLMQASREKKAARIEAMRLLTQASRLKQRQGARTLRKSQAADVVRETEQNVGELRSSSPAWWPGAGSVVQLIPGQERCVIGVAVEDVPAMLTYLAKHILRPAQYSRVAAALVSDAEQA
jgi:hypothetical protein